MKLLKTNDKIRNAVKSYNSEFAHRLNSLELSFTGSRIKGYSLYFKECNSGLIVSTITCGNERTLLTSIDAIYQFSGCRINIIKSLVA